LRTTGPNMETAGIPGGLRPYRNWRMKKAR
jgi:hypothetical protein